ncbi:hypothetical protein ACF0H5_001166 [Mactra antiquata]
MDIGELFFSYFSGPKVLIVGDSNIHRISTAVINDDCYSFDCLPVSGARYVHDTNRLRMKMKKMLQEDTYDHVFVHLGSNDVLCSFDVFYRESVIGLTDNKLLLDMVTTKHFYDIPSSMYYIDEI